MAGIFGGIPGGTFTVILLGLVVVYIYLLFYNTQLAIDILVRVFTILGKIILGIFTGISRIFQAIFRLFNRR